MPQRNKIHTLPSEVRDELDQRLIANGFGSHTELADWLAGLGFEISKSSVQRYSQPLERRIAQVKLASESAQALVTASGDDTGAVADASLRLIQERIYDVMLASEEEDLRLLSTAARALADTARAGTAVRQERRKVLKEAADAAAKQAGVEARKAGFTMPPEALREIRERVYGIYDD